MKSDKEIASFLSSKIHRALNDEGGDLSDGRKDAFDYYNGELYGNERDGYSKIVTREVLEAIEWAKPHILKVFTSGDRVVEFMPVNEQDVELAKQETDVINHILLKKNDGYMSFYSWITDALMNPVGYIKLMIEDVDTTITEPYEGVNELELMLLLEDEDVELIGSEEYKEMGEMLYNIKLRRTIREKALILDPVPPEQCLIDSAHRKLNLDEADFVCHRVQRTFTYLVEQGYDSEELREASADEGFQWNDEKVNRNYHEDEDILSDDDDDESMKQYWVHECYVRMDVDGDGLAERRKIVMVGNKIFENEEIDYQPIVSLATIPIPHKHPAMSLAETVMDLQLISSTLTRQLLDNIYKQNIRRKYVSEAAITDDGGTLDDLADNESEVIRVARSGEIEPEQVQPIIGEILSVIQHVGDHTQKRTGVAPQLSLDPNVLQQSTAGAFMGALDQASQRIEMYTRTMAETGFKWLMVKAHQLTRTYMDKPLTLELRGEWIDADPSSWRDRKDVSVNVGLGFNKKEMKIQLLSELLNIQKEAIGFGMADAEKIYNTLEQMVDAAGLGSVNRFFIDPKDMQPQPQEPSIEEKMLEMQAQIEQGKQALQQQKQGFESQLKEKELQLKAYDTTRTLDLKEREVAVKEQDSDVDAQSKAVDMEAQIIENNAVTSGILELSNG